MWGSSLYKEDTEAQKGQEGAQSHTASRGIQTEARTGHLSAFLGQLGSPMPPYPFFPPTTERENVFRPEAKECETEI